MIAAAALSYFTTHPNIHKKNDFDFVAIKEVAILFSGIFITMVPALELIRQNAARFGLGTRGFNESRQNVRSSQGQDSCIRCSEIGVHIG